MITVVRWPYHKVAMKYFLRPSNNRLSLFKLIVNIFEFIVGKKKIIQNTENAFRRLLYIFINLKAWFTLRNSVWQCDLERHKCYIWQENFLLNPKLHTLFFTRILFIRITRLKIGELIKIMHKNSKYLWETKSSGDLCRKD